MKLFGISTPIPNPFPLAKGQGGRKRGIISEVIGQSRRLFTPIVRWRRFSPTRDLTKPDYAFWDKARRCSGETGVRGLEMSGALLKPLASKTASWTLGQKPHFRVDNPKLEEALNEWFDHNHALILSTWEEAVALGDYYLALNPDGSLVSITPDVVDPIVADDDYSKIIGWRVDERFDHPTEFGKWQTIIDEYRPDERVRRVQFNDQEETIERFPNLIGRSMCVHVPNNKQSNEIFGKPEADALVRSEKGVLHTYGDILAAGVDGNYRQGRPTPVFSFEDSVLLDEFIARYGDRQTNTETDEESDYIDFDADKVVTIAGGNFDWKQPGAFAGEMLIVLNVLYWLFLEHTEMPEFVMGTAVASSRASVETQMPVFVKWIEKKRGQIEYWLNELIGVAADWLVLTNPGMGGYSNIRIQWDELTAQDGSLTLEAVKWLYTEGIIDKRTAIQLTPVEIEDIEGTLKAAEAERDNQEEAMQAQVERMINSNALTPNPSPTKAVEGRQTNSDELEDAA